MKVFSYIRVSSQGQVEKDGPVRQREAIAAFCAAHGLTLEREFFEEGVSGTVEAMDRPAFSNMLEVIEANAARPQPVEIIIVERLDRLARDLMVSEFLLAECRKRYIRVFAADQGQLVDMANSGDDPTRKLLRQILGAVAEWEKSALVKKLRASRERIRKQTGRCEGRLPYGSNAAEKIIRDLMLHLHSSGMGRTEIAKTLNQEGYLTRMGKAWNKCSVKNIITQRRLKKK